MCQKYIKNINLAFYYTCFIIGQMSNFINSQIENNEIATKKTKLKIHVLTIRKLYFQLNYGMLRSIILILIQKSLGIIAISSYIYIII